jgi:hypothetical protein
VEISYTDDNNATRTKKISVDRIYIVKKEHKGLLLGDRVAYGVIVGFGNKEYLVKMAEGYTTEKYPKK